MNPAVHSEKQYLIVYDADRIPEPDAAMFSAEFWRSSNAVVGEAAGRGNTLLLETGFGPAVLRHYRRGGWPAKLSEDRYLFTGIRRSRPYREFHLLRKLTALNLPVPAPLAAFIDNAFLSYRGALLMERIEGVRPLASMLGDSDCQWGQVGACIARFHKAGVNHADLNANNILVNSDAESVFLVDFDRCTLTEGHAVDGRRNLERLKRSLKKLWPTDGDHELEACWQSLLDGYRV